MSDANASNEKISGALGEILSNPQMLSAITSMAKNLKSAEEAKNTAPEEPSNQSEATEAVANTALPEILNLLSSAGNSTNAKQSRRSELLCALKPYLSQERSDAIDKIIRFSELSSVFKELS